MCIRDSQYLCFELEWDVRLTLAQGQVPRTRLGDYGRLGWTTWLGERGKAEGAAELLLDPEGLAAAGRIAAIQA